MFQQQNIFLGIPINPIAALAISIAITLKSCITLHLKTVKTEKQFVPFTSTFFILLWGLFSSLRRILSMVCFFIPSLGLFNILYHHKAEEIPFILFLQKYGKNQMDKIVLYGLNEQVKWGDLDRWDYSNSTEGTPPQLTEYTGLTLKLTFGLFFILTAAQFVTTLLVKIFTSNAFSRRENYLNKFLHLLLSLNIGCPFEDWDKGRFSISEYKDRQKQTNTEMACSLAVNIIFSLIFMVPLFYTGKYNFLTFFQDFISFLYIILILGYQIRSRHAILKLVSVTKTEEDQSFDNINRLLITCTSVMILSCVMEVLMYFLYNKKVHIQTW